MVIISIFCSNEKKIFAEIILHHYSKQSKRYIISTEIIVRFFSRLIFKIIKCILDFIYNFPLNKLKNIYS